ncbi:MAG: phenylalanine--tRNA ligase subunit alpha [Bacteroidetes bacterium]|jgi:phenylalanyl-tRNA synthetase alpha chain|nr:phenylalanine--tRNA ligase subunit alpha [Bacteroidota bacterium]MBT5529659.1 phenylalanine--tRNA ligase subunit alpha [Cytophagia bacterium]MBT7826177.1 phenylalanine--tRNA ligase subunit alpha [Bacteroidota bacterium]MBT7993563.1 phenylalanine--tRNA ligase subunit alpha [Bacteroidota bacterium]
MIEQIKVLVKQVETFEPKEMSEIEAFRIEYLGRKGIIQDLFQKFKNLDADIKREIGKPLNELKQLVTLKIDEFQEKLKDNEQEDTYNNIDISLDGPAIKLGSRHPVSIVKNQIVDIFSRIGFTQSVGPEVVDDWHNFTALNFPADHPAKDMQDTFFIQRDPDFLLRTHTSSVQVQEMQRYKPPIRTISIGRVYRNETISYKSHVQFHQIEGLYIEKKVSFSDLKQVLYYFVKQFFGDSFEVRFRPSFFPFTEPSAEMDIRAKNGDGKWMEILGCGMVDPNVLSNCGIDHENYTGYAFGMGIERMSMLKYGIKDIRVLYENDIRFLEQFIAER